MEKLITEAFLDDLLAKAAENPRLRTNFNLHESTDEPTNRLCIAAQPGTQFPIHRHPGKWELLTMLRGRVTSLIFNDDGEIIRTYELGGDTKVLELAPGTWHSLEVHEPVVFMEVKPGPYQPIAPEDTLPAKSENK